MIFDNYIAIDWAQAKIAIARTTNLSEDIVVREYSSDIKLIKKYLMNLRGSTILTFEETTVSQWLYVELVDYVDRLIVCDPRHNHLLRKGPKTDKIDAIKLAMHLKSGYIHEVYHSAHKFMELRKLVSAYEDVIAHGVRLKNQRAAIMRSKGKSKRCKVISNEIDQLNIDIIDRNIQAYEESREVYQRLFSDLVKENEMLANLNAVPGIGIISTVKIAATVVEGNRFSSKYHFWSYCGLAKHCKMSGGRSYGRRYPRHRKTMKAVFKIAALSVIRKGQKNPFCSYYFYLMEEKNIARHNARHAVARKIAAVVINIMKNEGRYEPKKLRTT